MRLRIPTPPSTVHGSSTSRSTRGNGRSDASARHVIQRLPPLPGWMKASRHEGVPMTRWISDGVNGDGRPGRTSGRPYVDEPERAGVQHRIGSAAFEARH